MKIRISAVKWFVIVLVLAGWMRAEDLVWEVNTVVDQSRAAATFGILGGVAVDRFGGVIVADDGTHTVRRVAPSGRVTTLAGKAGARGFKDGNGVAARFWSLRDIGVSAANDIIVMDAIPASWSYATTLRRISPEGDVTTILPPDTDWGTEASKYWWDAEAMAVDQAGNTYLHDSKADQICRISLTGEISTFAVAASPVRYPIEELAVDRAGNVYVANWQGKKILKFSPDGKTVSTVLAVGGALEFAQIDIINGLVCDEQTGDLVMTDHTFGGVFRISPAGVVRRVTGGGGNMFTHDDVAGAATFTTTQDLAMDDRGNIFVSDFSVVRHVAPDGRVRVLAGVPKSFAHQDGTGTARRLALPNQVAVAPDGTVIVADRELRLLLRVEPDGSLADFVGSPGKRGFADGVGAAAEFDMFSGMVFGPDGNLYIVEYSTIRRVTPDGQVSTIAGTPGVIGSRDGPAAQATFYDLQGIAIAPDGTIYVSDRNNSCIRRISPAGIVDTFAGQNGERGTADGDRATARIFNPTLLALTPAGNLYLHDLLTIRRIDATGAIKTITGAWAANGAVDGPADVARLDEPGGFVVDAAGNLFFTQDCCVRMMTPDGTISTIVGAKLYAGNGPVVDSGFKDGVGADARFIQIRGIAADSREDLWVVDEANQAVRKLTRVNAVRSEPAVSWSSTLTLKQDEPVTTRLLNATAALPGKFVYTYAPGVTLQPGTHPVAVQFVPDDLRHYHSVTLVRDIVVTAERAQSGKLVNLSTRSTAGSGAESLVIGVVLGGNAPAPVLFRSIGPTLAKFQVPGALPDPRISLFGHDGVMLSANDNWGGGVELTEEFQRLGAFALEPTSLDAALLSDLVPGPHTVVVGNNGTQPGEVLMEAYLAGPSTSPAGLVNLSTRSAVVDSVNRPLTLGFVIEGETPATLLIRGIGPALETFGVTNTLADPKLRVFDAKGREVLANDNWAGATALRYAFDVTGAFPLPDAASQDAVLLTTLAPGLYTVQITGPNGATGVAMAEVYLVP